MASGAFQTPLPFVCVGQGRAAPVGLLRQSPASPAALAAGGAGPAGPSLSGPADHPPDPWLTMGPCPPASQMPVSHLSTVSQCHLLFCLFSVNIKKVERIKAFLLQFPHRGCPEAWRPQAWACGGQQPGEAGTARASTESGDGRWGCGSEHRKEGGGGRGPPGRALNPRQKTRGWARPDLEGPRCSGPGKRTAVWLAVGSPVAREAGPNHSAP